MCLNFAHLDEANSLVGSNDQYLLITERCARLSGTPEQDRIDGFAIGGHGALIHCLGGFDLGVGVDGE